MKKLIKIFLKAYRGTREAGEWRDVMVAKQLRHAGGVQHLARNFMEIDQRNSGEVVASQNDDLLKSKIFLS